MIFECFVLAGFLVVFLFRIISKKYRKLRAGRDSDNTDTSIGPPGEQPAVQSTSMPATGDAVTTAAHAKNLKANSDIYWFPFRQHH